MKVSGLRHTCKEYYDSVFCVADNIRQISPFIVIDEKENTIQAVQNITNLLLAPDDCIVCHAWPGKWRTDVFTFTALEFKNECKKRGRI